MKKEIPPDCTLRIGICGGHRTGKTTLAKRISEKLRVECIRTSTSRVFAENGLDPAMPMEFSKRIWIQHKVIEAGEAAWAGGKNTYVTDRTPLDMLAYTLGDIRGDTYLDFQELEKYMNRCFSSTNRFFDRLILVQPGIPLMPGKGKAALNPGYIEHLNSLILGLIFDPRTEETLKKHLFILPRNLDGADLRAEAALLHIQEG